MRSQGSVYGLDRLLFDPRPYRDNRLYVRLGNSTEELTGRDMEDWLRGRQG